MAGLESRIRPGTVELLVDGPGLHAEAGEPPTIEVGSEAPAAPPPAVKPGDQDKRVQLARRLAETRIVVDRVLETVSESRLEARRLVTKDLGIDPRPEVLNTIVKVACDRSADGLRRELPRHLLTVQSLIEHEVARLLDAPGLDAPAIRACQEMLPDLQHLSCQIQEDITNGMDAVTADARDYLLQVCNSLCAPEDKVCSALLLAPRLELFARAGGSGQLREIVPSLQDDEALLLDRLFQDGSTDDVPARTCLNSIALRSLLCEAIARWKSICDDAPGPGALVDVPPGYVERMGREKVAFHFISERLQDKQDAALQAGLHRFADEVRAFRQNLFATYLEFTPALRDATAGRASEQPSGDKSTTLSMVEATAQPDAAAGPAQVDARSQEEVYLRALTDMRRPATSRKPAPSKRVAVKPQPGRGRMWALVGAAGLLAAIGVVLYVMFG